MANSEFDKKVGQNLATLRASMTQQALAHAMRQQGHRWTQATVWSIETGGRALKLDEAMSAASILGLGPWGAIKLAGEDNLETETVLRQASRFRERAVEALFAYMKARATLASEMAGAEYRLANVSPMLFEVAGEMLSSAGDPARLIDDAREMWVREPLPSSVDFDDDDPLERGMREYIEYAENRYPELWRRILEARGADDGEHPEAP